MKERHLNKKNGVPLHIAAFTDSVKIGELLIAKGADINAIDIIDQNIKILFLIKIILNKLRQLNKKNKTILYLTYQKSSKEMFEFLISKGAENNSKEIGEILISKGADINAKAIIYLNIGILFLINLI